MTQRPLPTPEDDTDRWLLAQVAEHGWAVIGIPEDEAGPTYSFSVGMSHTLDHPEILVMGLEPGTAQHVINGIGAAVRAGRRFEPGRRYDDLVAERPLEFVLVAEQYQRPYLGYARWFYRGSDFATLQCIWPDPQNRFPWEAGYDGDYFRVQRVLGPVASWERGWPFPDPPNVAAFTVKQIGEGDHPILSVYHDGETNAWQFLTGGPCSMADVRIEALGEMVRRDPTLTELGDLPPGWRAWREAAGAPWQRGQRPETNET